MNIHRFETSDELGRAAATSAAQYLRSTIHERGSARILVATGASQFAFLEHLTRASGIDWSMVTMFHLDEYIGLSSDHPASFKRYLQTRLVDKVRPGTCVWIDGTAEPYAECQRLGALIMASPVDIACVGIGENGHLAFNDPPADFETNEAYIVVRLAESCRAQQVGEGWFQHVDDVPAQAISISIQQIMRARKLLCVVPDLRKAEAVRACLEEEISPLRPASIVQRHSDVDVYLDADSASLLSPKLRRRAEG